MSSYSVPSAQSGAVIQTITDMAGRVSAMGSNSDLIEVSSIGRVEPITLVENSLISYENISEVYLTVQSIYIGFYLQAVSVKCSISDVNVRKILKELSPGAAGPLAQATDAVTAASTESYVIAPNANSMLSQESYRWRLPTPKSLALENTDRPSLTRNKIGEQANPGAGVMMDVDFNVDDGKGGKKLVKFPITFRLMVMPMSDVTIKAIFTHAAVDRSDLERWHQWRAGRITFWRDLVFADDLAREHRKILLDDTTGIYSTLVKNARNKRLMGMIDPNEQSSNISSNIYVISSALQAKIELDLGGKLTNRATREKIFGESLAMMIVVVDAQWERVNFFYRGLDGYSSLSIKDLKAANKNKGIDPMDLMKSFNNGAVPRY